MSIVSIEQNGIKQDFPASDGENLLELLRREGYNITAPCGGKGKCGKCAVTLVRDGKRETVSACRAVINGDCAVILPDSAGLGEIMAEGAARPFRLSPREGLGAAVDIGTTTVVIKLFELTDGKELGSLSRWNAQAPYGADVLSRAQYCMEKPDGLERLSSLIRTQVLDMLRALCWDAGTELSDLKEIFLAGNTVMQHIFAGLSPAGIALAPFSPETLFDGGKSEDFHGIALFYSPCVAGYVGGDITAGLLSALPEEAERALFLDVGTNGEMALGGKGGFVSCAVACGPAFEGAGISCGMASLPGAISHVTWNGGFEYHVIGGGKPTGICGSGLLDLMAVLLSKGLVDESGRLLAPDEAPEGFEAWLDEDENGNGLLFLTEEDDSVYFTAGDVRQLQLAKAAVVAGIHVLLDEAGIDVSHVEKLYLAGGFGSHLKAESAAAMGMLPKELVSKTVTVGNASLSGAALALLSLNKRRELYDIQKKCAYLELSGSAAFNEVYPEYMSFGEED